MSSYRRYFVDTNPVFITFVTKNRKKILVNNVEILRAAFKYAQTKFEYKIVACVILPDHCHFILSTNEPNTIPKIIATIKSYFSLHIPQQYKEIEPLSASELQRNEKGVWQRRYYDHIIRNENDLRKHIDYIHYNPTKHCNILPKDWLYSSFSKFVKNKYYEPNWYNVEDKYKIKDILLE